MIHADDLTNADEAIIGALHAGDRTKGAIIDETGLHRNTVGNRLDVLAAGDVVEEVHGRTALYTLVNDPSEDDAADEQTDPEARRAATRLAKELEDCREQLERAREANGLPDSARRSLKAARTALDGGAPDVDLARSELDAALEAIGDE